MAVGIPSFREAETIAHVVRAVDRGLAAWPEVDGRIVNVDGASDDGTVSRFLAEPTRAPKVSLVAEGAPAGKGRNVRDLLSYALDEGLDGVATIDADLRSVTPDWPRALLAPVVDGEVDFTAPDYCRSRYRGVATNHFAYPLVFGWLGADIRQPIGGEFGLSRAFAAHVLVLDWPAAAFGYGIDLFLTGHAVAGGFRWRLAALGEKVDRDGHGRFDQVAIEVMASGLHLARRVELAPEPALEAAGGPVTSTGSYPGPDPTAVRRRSEVMRARASGWQATYRRWLGHDAGPGGPDVLSLSADAWSRLLVGALVDARRATGLGVEGIAARLVPPLWGRTLTAWREGAQRSASEVDGDLREQARLVRAFLAERAEELGRPAVRAGGPGHPGGPGQGGKPSSV